jgi:hypothetical protein
MFRILRRVTLSELDLVIICHKICYKMIWSLETFKWKGDRNWLGDMGLNDALLYPNNYVLYAFAENFFFKNLFLKNL